MKNHTNDCFLCSVPDAALFDETARRLIQAYETKFGITLIHGHHVFEFAFQNGAFLGINKSLKRNIYLGTVAARRL